jgi:3-dehydroquinate synthase
VINPKRITVPIPGRSYDIVIGKQAVAFLPDLLRSEAPAPRYVIVSDENVAAAYGDAVTSYVKQVAPTSLITFASGESSKTRAEWARITDLMMADGIGRDAVVIALGGGITGDLAGFVAATYQRGLEVVQIPTSLLAMIDSSVGGKTGINTDRGKNLVGAFHQPKLVIVDPSFLETLPDRHLRAGLAEALKHGIIADADYFNEIVANRGRLLDNDQEIMGRVIQRSLQIKSDVVTEDERENGRRAILNFGHTVGHAMETVTNHEMLHGECVAAGMVAETGLAVELGIADPTLLEAVRTAVEAFDLPASIPASSSEKLISVMRGDKKNREGKIRFSLPERVGSMARAERGSWTIPVDENVTKRILESTP